MKITDLKQNEVIHCKTREEAVRICGMMHEAGLTWEDGESYIDSTEWEEEKHNTCYNPNSGEFCYVDFYHKNGYTIHPSELFQDSDEITEDGLRARGFEKPKADRDEFILDNGRYFALTSNISCVYLRAGGQYETPTNCETLTDIDHLIRLLAV